MAANCPAVLRAIYNPASIAHAAPGNVAGESILSRLVLPLPPSVNHSYLRRGKAAFKTEQAKAWQEAATWKAKAWYRGPLRKEKTILNVWVYWGDARRRDCSNLFKLLEDALTGIVWIDDYYCLPRVQNWEIDRGNGRVEISIETF